MIQLDRNQYLLESTGRQFYANAGYIGINHETSREVSEGYDGSVWVDDYDENGNETHWTGEECAELADFMIRRWQDFKERHSGR